MSSDDDNEEEGQVEEYFGESPPVLPPEEKQSLFWPVVRIIASIATAAYLIAVVGIPLGSKLFTVSGNSQPLAPNICAFLIDYACGNPQLSAGSITFTFAENTGTAFSNITLYAVPSSANFTLQGRSQFPSSQHIASMVSYQSVLADITGGSGAYALPGSGTYSASVWIVYSSVQGPMVQKIGVITVTS